MIPVVRHFIVCEDMLRHPDNPNKVTLVNLISTIRPLDDAGFPLCVPQLCVFAQATECRGTGILHLRIEQSDSGEEVFRSSDWVQTFSNRPLDVVGIPFRILDCTFPTPGVYDVELWYGADRIAQQPIRVEEFHHVDE